MNTRDLHAPLFVQFDLLAIRKKNFRFVVAGPLTIIIPEDTPSEWRVRLARFTAYGLSKE
jgi:hypothetical protein